MKKIYKYLLLMICLIPLKVFAEDKYVNAGNVIHDTGIVTHNYFSAGNALQNDMEIDGLLFTAGNSINYNGKSEYSFIAGNLINFNGKSEKDVFVAGNTINIAQEAIINRDLYLAASDVNINADIIGNAFISAKNLTINSKNINGDLYLSAENIVINEDSVINGTIKYPENANISGIENISAEKLIAYQVSTNSKDNDFASKVTSTIFSMICYIAVAYILYLIFPTLFNKIERKFEFKNTIKTIGSGLAFLIIVPIISIILLITVVGIPISILTLIAYGVLLYLSLPVTANYLGNVILKNSKREKTNFYLATLIGILVLKIVNLIPIIGSIISILSMLYGLGYYLVKYKTYKETKK